MSMSVRDLPPTVANLEKARFWTCAGWFSVSLAKPRRNARKHVRLYRAADGTPYVRNRLYGPRAVVVVRVLVVDGEPLNCGSVVLAEVGQ